MNSVQASVTEHLAEHVSNKTNVIHVGLCGAGIGGVFAAIAIARAGARVTVLEATDHLGEVFYTRIVAETNAESWRRTDWCWHTNDTQCC